MLIDMIHDNHGEPPFKTRYRDPALLRAMGFHAIAIPDALAALPCTYDPASRELKWSPRQPHELEAAIDEQYRNARGLGMQLFFYGDALLLPRIVTARKPEKFFCDDASGRLCPAKPAVLEALQDQVEELFDRWPAAAGLIMRTGEVYPEATPHMLGTPLHLPSCPACRELNLLERLTRFITAMHAVTSRLGKLYIHRAWQGTPTGTGTNSFNIHDDPAAYRSLSDRLPHDDHLLFSFKFTRGDSRAPRVDHGNSAQNAHAFNPCLFADDRPKWLEFQCEREHEGKGAFPNYQGPIWGQFLHWLTENARKHGIDWQNRFSLWGWSRGGGWGGPYVQREEWIDANVHALAAFFADPARDPADVATQWVGQAFSVAESSPPAPAIAELLAISAPAIRKLLYVSALPRAEFFVRDDFLDVDAIYHAAEAIIALGRHAFDEALAEKREALEAVDRMRQLLDIAAPELPNKSQLRDLTNALAYFHSFANALAHLFTGFTRKLASRANPGDAALHQQAIDDLHSAQRHWQLHAHYYALMPGAPSMFHENTQLWDRTNACLAALEEPESVRM